MSEKLRRFVVLLAMLFFVAGVVPAQDVMFYDDFENREIGDEPPVFLPSGSASPDWDNDLLNPLGGTVTANAIQGAFKSNSTLNYMLAAPVKGNHVLLGANFSPSSDRYVIVEYDVLINGNAIEWPGGEIYYSDGYGDLDGSSGSKIAIHLQFNDRNTVTDDNGNANGYVYYTTGEDNDVTTDDGSEWVLVDDDTNMVPWIKSDWIRVQVVADQEAKTWDVKMVNLDTLDIYIATGLPFNDLSAGYIRKVWFANTVNNLVAFDNIKIYQNSTSPPAGGPTVLIYDYAAGPANANTGLDVSFTDDTDLTSVQYKIGSGGTWTDLTDDGTMTIDVSGGSDTSVSSPVFITDADFASLPEGTTEIYIRADNGSVTVEGVGSISFVKDTESPTVASVTSPNPTIIASLPEISGRLLDSVSGVAADSATFTLQRSDNAQYWDGAAWQAAATPLATTHVASSSEITWTDNVALPPLTAVQMTAQATIADVAGNAALVGAPISFTVDPDIPGITIANLTPDPSRNNAFSDLGVELTDNVDLQAAEYKVGSSGTWTALTTNGTTAVDVSGGSDVLMNVPVYITDADFAALPDGQANIYIRATDSTLNTSTTLIPIVLTKDATLPDTITLTAPSGSQFASLPTVTGTAGDATGGAGLDANSTTFTIRRSSDSAYWTGSIWDVETNLATTHPATTDDTAVAWTKNAVIPSLTDLTDGITYTFAVTVTDRAENTNTSSFALLYDNVPEVASVTSPADGSFSSTAFTVSGSAADNEGGIGLAADSTTYTFVQASDGQYWNGTGWQVGAVSLASTHSATTGSNPVTWTPAAGGQPPSAGNMTDGTYYITATATNGNGSYTGSTVSAMYDGTAPLISTATIVKGNAYMTITFSEPVWGDSGLTTAIVPGDFSLSFQQNTGGITGSSITGFYVDTALTTPLSASTGYSTVYAALSNTGGTSDGTETLTVTANAASIYDRAANDMANTETTGAVNFEAPDITPPGLSSLTTGDTDGDGYIDVLVATFDEEVDDTTINSG